LEVTESKGKVRSYLLEQILCKQSSHDEGGDVEAESQEGGCPDNGEGDPAGDDRPVIARTIWGRIVAEYRFSR
jgi:hypothetical protein